MNQEQANIAKLAERVDWDSWWPLRRHMRHRVEFPITVRETREGTVQSFSGQSTDLSEAGVGAELSASLQTGEIVSLELVLPATPAPVVIAARVRHRAGNTIGFEFLAANVALVSRIKSACQPSLA